MKPFLWERFSTDGRLNGTYDRSGGTLAALRRGAHTEAGATASMWPYYTQLNSEGRLTPSLRAEHVCLVAYGVHQQGVGYSAHLPEVGLGEALRRLKHSGKFSEDAVDRHVEQFATATQLDELSHHLLTLVNLLKATKLPIGFDYSRLFKDLRALQDELQAGRVRRRWGADYFRPESTDNTTSRSKS